MSKGTKVRTVRIEDALWEAAQNKARESGRNLSAIIRQALYDYLDEEPGVGASREVLEWATDYWGEIMDEDSEDSARKLAAFKGVKLYSRVPRGHWEPVTCPDE